MDRVKLPTMRVTRVLLLANYLAFAGFITIRPSEAFRLQEADVAYARGEFSISSGAPYTYIAARPLYSWSEWHGGEHVAVKVLEIINSPALLAASSFTPFIGTIIGASKNYGWSHVRGVLFVILATVQWLGTGKLINRRHSGLSRAA